MGSDAETIRAVASEEVLDAIVFVRILFEPTGPLRFHPSVPLGRKTFEVGRAAEGRLTVNDPRASRRHAVLHPKAEGRRVELEDTSSNGTFVNGLRVQGRTELSDGDIVRLGDSFLLIRITSPAPGTDAEIPAILGRHPSMRDLRRTIEAVAPSGAKVLIMGESGTGKELVARAIHDRSGRTGRFVAVNCSAIPDSLAESQLFGHEAGAFTGANSPHGGFMRAADGGTLFLDEVGELSPVLQPKLLRALEEQVVVPVGSTVPVPVDVRLIAATHRDLLHEVDADRFRGDLYARIAGYMMQTVPLRDRREDILPLLGAFLEEGGPTLAPDLAEALLLHPYRFNVRELKEIATQLKIDGAGMKQLPKSLIEHRLTQTPFPASYADQDPLTTLPSTPRTKRPPPRKDEVLALMRETNGNVSQVARSLGRSRRQVYRYLEQWGISPDDFVPSGG